VSLVWNGAPLDDFAPVGRERALKVRRELGLPAEATVVGTIGRLNAQKGHRFLLDAAAPLCRRHSDLRVLIVGDGDLMEALQAQRDRLGLTDRVILAGHRTDVPDLLAALDVFCISSLYEGTPLALFEAMAAGRPVVSTAVDGCREILEEGISALLVPPADAGALETALERIISDPSLREKLSRRAHEASRRYDVRSCVRQMEAIYESLLDTEVA
jgi:glycosyltransferase involved in cell wall biosynthesis